MKSFVVERIEKYSKSLGNNVALFEEDGSLIEAIDLDFDSLLDAFLKKVDEGAGEAGYKTSFETLKAGGESKEAESLLDQSKIKDADLNELFMAFLKNDVFQGRIIICGQNITDVSAIKLSEIIGNNVVKITQVNLSHNPNLKKETGIYLGEALRTNTSIMSLLLAGNQLGTDGVNRITEALRFNTTIAELDLGIISNESLEYLIKFLKENSTLNHLFIEEDPNSPWKTSTKENFIKTVRVTENLLSIAVKVQDILAEQKFLGQLAQICEFNRGKYVENLEHENNIIDPTQNQYYATEFDFINSGLFSIKSYVSNVFGSQLEASLYKIEKARLDLLRSRKTASIMGTEQDDTNAHILTADGSLLELAKELYCTLEKEKQSETL